MRGEKIYDYVVDMTEVTDFGVSLDDILSGAKPVPPQGARFNAGFAGKSQGRLTGAIAGTDFANVRADGRFELNMHAVFETDDGHRIALWANGVATPRADSPVLDLAENVHLTTAAPDYAWVNGKQIWATGTVDLATGKIQVTGYSQ